MTPEQLIARKKRLVSSARELFALRNGLTYGSLRIRKQLSQMGSPYKEAFPIFDKFIDATLSLPISDERLLWAPKSVLKEDKKLEKIEAKYRSKILESCIDIIEKYKLD